jgi:hypothetical protein
MVGRNAPKAVRDEKQPLRAWSQSDAQKFIEFVSGDRLEALWVLLITTGLPRGEALRSFPDGHALAGESAAESATARFRNTLGAKTSTSEWRYRVPDVTGSQGVRGSNPLSSTRRLLLEPREWPFDMKSKRPHTSGCCLAAW